jgi:hypothetical protein
VPCPGRILATCTILRHILPELLDLAALRTLHKAFKRQLGVKRHQYHPLSSIASSIPPPWSFARTVGRASPGRSTWKDTYPATPTSSLIDAALVSCRSLGEISSRDTTRHTMKPETPWSPSREACPPSRAGHPSPARTAPMRRLVVTRGYLAPGAPRRTFLAQRVSHDGPPRQLFALHR